MEGGTGAICGCPGQDRRDLEFARKYRLRVIPVGLPPGEDPATFTTGATAYVDDGMLINSAFLDGLSVAEAKRTARARRAELRHAALTTRSRRRACGASRQRHWRSRSPGLQTIARRRAPAPGTARPRARP